LVIVWAGQQIARSSLSQNPLGSYAVENDDLPAAPALQPAAQTQPRDEQGRFQSPSAAPAPTGATAAPAAPAQPAAPQHAHNPYMLARARQFGIDPTSLSPEALGAVLTAVEANRPAAPATVAPPPEPAIDWGDDDQGKPITSEEQAKQLYPRAVFNAIKAAHELAKIKDENKSLRQSIEDDRRQRNAAAIDAKLGKLLGARPDLFGEGVDPNIVAARKQAVMNHLSGLVAAKQHTTLETDVAAALAIFGPAPGGKPAKGPSPADVAAAYRKGELPRPTGRHSVEGLSRYERLLQEEIAKKQEQNGSAAVVGGDDNSDLPDAPKG
jgi:hypothetical protein